MYSVQNFGIRPEEWKGTYLEKFRYSFFSGGKLRIASNAYFCTINAESFFSVPAGCLSC